jgi:hypothetical protein
MAKKNATPVTESVEQAEKVLAQAPTATAGLDGTLAEEIQAFLARREELAQRLVSEIAATEQRLAALRQSAALLGAEPATERKAKKPAAKKAKPTKAAAAVEEAVNTPEPLAASE